LSKQVHYLDWDRRKFIPEIDFSSVGNVADPGVWSHVNEEGVEILEDLANIRVPVIAAIEGHANVHTEYAPLVDVIVAGEGAPFNDLPQFAGGLEPGEGTSQPAVTEQDQILHNGYLLPLPLTLLVPYLYCISKTTSSKCINDSNLFKPSLVLREGGSCNNRARSFLPSGHIMSKKYLRSFPGSASLFSFVMERGILAVNLYHQE
jgi:hypothetical protein